MSTYGEVDMSDYDPQASLDAHEAIEAQRGPTEGDRIERILGALAVAYLLGLALTVLVLYWAVQIP